MQGTGITGIEALGAWEKEYLSMTKDQSEACWEKYWKVWKQAASL